MAADFTAPSFSAAAAFVQQVAAAADAARHHPDIDLRYPGIVRVTLTTHGAGGLTEADASLATTIAELAKSAAMTADFARVSQVEIAIDALDFDAVMPFWKAVLGYIEETPAPGQPVDALVDPVRIGPSLWFQQMDAPRPQRNRIHLDLRLPHDLAEARITAAVAARGRLVSDAHARAFWVLADPEGNEICICTWQDRD